MFGVPALCEIGGRGLVPGQHSAISTDAPDEVGAFVVADAPLVACLPCVISQFLSAGHARGHVCGHVGSCAGWRDQHYCSWRQVGSRLQTCWRLRRLGRPAFQREFFGHGHIVVFVERPRHALAILAFREVLLCKKRAVVTSLLKAMLLEMGVGALGMCTF